MERFYEEEVYSSQSIVKLDGCTDADYLFRFYQLTAIESDFKKEVTVVFLYSYAADGAFRYEVIKASACFQTELFYNFIPDIEKRPYERRIFGENYIVHLLCSNLPFRTYAYRIFVYVIHFIVTLYVYKLANLFLFGQKHSPSISLMRMTGISGPSSNCSSPLSGSILFIIPVTVWQLPPSFLLSGTK